VTFFNETKGYGFATDDRGREIFIHVSELAPNVNSLRKGERVAVEVVKGQKGFEGKNVRSSGRGPGRRRS
jgi:CspA family cold shock protein